MTSKSIYRIIDATNDKTIFISSTNIPLSLKLSELKQNYKKNKGCKKYKASFNEVGIDNLIIELIENYEYYEIEELRKQENYYKRLYNIILVDKSNNDTDTNNNISNNTNNISNNISNNTSNITHKPSFINKPTSINIITQVKNMGC